MSLLRAGIRELSNSLFAEAGAVGSSRVSPAALNAETVAGPWKLTVLQVQTGDEASAAVTGASQFNVGPSDGSMYVTARVRAVNASTRDYDIEPDDFGVTGASGILSRFSQQIPPDPPLHATVKAGQTIEGWIVADVAASETNLLLIYDSLSITGTWSDAVFALAVGAAIPDLTKAAASKNAAGMKASAPAQIGDQIVTGEWAVKLIEVVSGQDVINLFPTADYRTTALLGGDAKVADVWLGLHMQVTNVRIGGSGSFLPATAFSLATSDGKQVNDVRLLTPPDPDVSGTYYPGANRDGWVLFEQPTDYPDSIVRFLPFMTDFDPRYFNFGSGGSAPAPTAPAQIVPAGSKVTVSEQVVNLRSKPSTSGTVVVELKQGDVLTVTGAPVAGGDYQWYPVTDDVTGKSGYVATKFVTAAG